MELSEKQLLLLDEFMYSDIAPKSEKTTLSDAIAKYVDSEGNVSVDSIQRDIDNGTLKLSGDMNKNAAAMADVMQQIHDDSYLSSLKISNTTVEYEGSIRGACFVDEATGEATVAFRGTGGSYNQWQNNFEGYGDISMESQRDAAKFIESLPYDHITVTGHSNGGNQAMYATVVCGDKIDRCVSYEGQGFSDEFCEAYSQEIALNRGKIKSISADTDFVNTLLNNIAPDQNTVYLKTKGDTIFKSFTHGGYGLLQEEDNFNRDGSIHKTVSQSSDAEKLHNVIVTLAHLSDVPGAGRQLERFMDLVGSLVGLYFSEKSKVNPGFDTLTLINLINATVDQITSQVEYYIGLAPYIEKINKLKQGAKEAAEDLWEKVTGAVEAAEEKAKSIIEAINPFGKKSSAKGSGGGGHSGGGGRTGGSASGGKAADVIKVSTSQMAAAVKRYQTEKTRLMDAVNICNQAAQTLAQSWVGPSFLAMSLKLAETYKNLFPSVEKIEDAISELNQIIQIYERAEGANTAAAAGLEIGESPFN